MGKPEGRIENHLIARCEENGFVCRKYTSPGRKGPPDRIVMCRGHVVFIECKSPTGTLSPIQKLEIKKMLRQGCDVRVYSSKEQIDGFIEEALGWKPARFEIPEDMKKLLE